MDKLLEDLAEVVRQRNAAEYAAVALSADDFYAENKEFRSKAVRFIASHHAKIAEAVKDARRYQWIRNDQTGQAEEVILVDRYGDVEVRIGDDLDAAIDAQHNSAREGE